MLSKGGAKRIRVGIIGANPERGWAAQAHIPALRSLADDFEITALSTSRRESADAASKVFDVPVAFDNHQDLVNNPSVDVVAVTGRVSAPIADPYGSDRIGLKLTARIDRTDFGVDWNNPLPSGEPALANDVTILAELQFVKPGEETN